MRAISTVQHGGTFIRKEQMTYGLPFNKIWSWVNDCVYTDCNRPGPKPFLGTECEKEIYELVTELQRVGHGLSGKKILQLAEDVDSKKWHRF